MRNLANALTLSLAVLGIHTGVALGARWTEMSTGMSGSVAGVRMVVIDRATGSTLYALTSAGDGVFKSTDGGASWKALGNIVDVRVLAIDPTSASTIYAGAGRGVFKSTNGGESWGAAGLSGTSVSTLAVDPITPSTLYAAGFGDHIYKSTDRGGTWTDHSVGLPASSYFGVSSITIDPFTPSTLYVVSSCSCGIGSAVNKSTDGGESWIVIDPGPFASLLTIDPTNPSTLYAIRYTSGLSKSTDGGATWTATGFTKDVIALAIDPRNSGTLYASTSGPNQSGQAIYKSTDGGRSWNLVNTSIPLVGSLVFSPANSSTIYAVTYKGGVFQSTDAGTNWSETNTGLRVLGIQALVGDPADPATVYAGGDEGLFKSVDRGGSWIRQAAFQLTVGEITGPGGVPLPLPATPPFPAVAPASVHSLLIDFTNPNILYAGTHRTDGCFFADILLFKSTDDGANWSDSITPKQSGCLADRLMAMDPADPNTLYLRFGNDFGDGFGLEKTTDGGAHWTFTGLSADALNALAIDPTSPATLYAGTDRGVSRSTDGGATWNLIGLAQANVTLLAIDPLQPNVLYAGTTGFYPAPGFRGLFKSTDSGANWSPINDGLGDVVDTHAPVNALVLDLNDTETLYAATSGYGVFKSSDGGATWAAFSEGLTHLDVRVLAIARGEFTTVYAGTPGGVFRIVEDGK